jgi:hypothetical protein
MANAIYGKAREKFLNADIDWSVDTIKVALVDTASYTVAIDTDEFYSTISSAVVGTPITLSGKTSTLGVGDANDVSFTGLSGAPSIEALAIYKDTGVAGTSPLLVYIDTATGLPEPAGATQVDVTWDNGANKIFKL